MTRKRGGLAGAIDRLALASAFLLFVPGGTVLTADEPDVPLLDGGLGPCSVSFTVTDKDKQPVYDAKIDVIIRHGFMSLRKNELQIGTNSEGKARLAGLPQRVRKPLEFNVTSGPFSRLIVHDPSVKCDATFEVALETE